MGRELRRVPEGFDWPIDKVWHGFLMPDELRLPDCPVCGGDGYSSLARHLHRTFYDHNVLDGIGWGGTLTQAEVDHLLAHNRLNTWRDGAWHADPLTAAEVNAGWNNRRGRLTHDSVNVWLLVDFRCEKLGAPDRCDRCGGTGDVGTPEQRAAHEAWEQTEPPTGPWWQVWETVSEGSPITPAFATPEELASYWSQMKVWHPPTYEQALKFITGPGWAPSFVVGTSGVQDGVVAVTTGDLQVTSVAEAQS